MRGLTGPLEHFIVSIDFQVSLLVIVMASRVRLTLTHSLGAWSNAVEPDQINVLASTAFRDLVLNLSRSEDDSALTAGACTSPSVPGDHPAETNCKTARDEGNYSASAGSTCPGISDGPFLLVNVSVRIDGTPVLPMRWPSLLFGPSQSRPNDI